MSAANIDVADTVHNLDVHDGQQHYVVFGETDKDILYSPRAHLVDGYEVRSFFSMRTMIAGSAFKPL